MWKILQKEITIQNVTLTEAGEFQNDLLPFSLVQANSQDIHPRYTLHVAKRTKICSLRISKYDSSYLRQGHKIDCMFHDANALKFFCSNCIILKALPRIIMAKCDMHFITAIPNKHGCTTYKTWIYSTLPL